MTNDSVSLETRRAALRAAFDSAFALPRSRVRVETEDVLAVRVAGTMYVIRLCEISGIVARRRVTPVPAAASHLLGVAGIRGAILPIFDLASILGHDVSIEPPNWIVLAGGEDPVGLAFAEFTGYLRVPRSSFRLEESRAATGGYTRNVVRTEAGVLAVVELPRVMANLKTQGSQSGPAKET